MTTACHPSYSSQAIAAIIIAMSISIPTRKRVKYCVLLTPSPPYCAVCSIRQLEQVVEIRIKQLAQYARLTDAEAPVTALRLVIASRHAKLLCYEPVAVTISCLCCLMEQTAQ